MYLNGSVFGFRFRLFYIEHFNYRSTRNSLIKFLFLETKRYKPLLEAQAKLGPPTGPRSTFCKDHLEESMSICTTLNQRVTTVHLKIIYSPSCHLQSVSFSVELKSRVSKNDTSIIFLELEKV